MLVVKYPNTYPFYSASELEDLKFLSGTILWIKEGDCLDSQENLEKILAELD